MKPPRFSIAVALIGLFACFGSLAAFPTIVLMFWMNPDMTERRLIHEYPWIMLGFFGCAVVTVAAHFYLSWRHGDSNAGRGAR